MPIIVFLGSYLGGYALAKHRSHKKYMTHLSVVNSKLTPGSFMSLLDHSK